MHLKKVWVKTEIHMFCLNTDNKRIKTLTNRYLPGTYQRAMPSIQFCQQVTEDDGWLTVNNNY